MPVGVVEDLFYERRGSFSNCKTFCIYQAEQETTQFLFQDMHSLDPYNI